MAEFLPLCDVLFNVISLAGYFCDVVFDVVLGYALYERGKYTYFAAVVIIVSFSLIISQIISFKWYLNKKKIRNLTTNTVTTGINQAINDEIKDDFMVTKSSLYGRYAVIFLHFTQFGVLWRYAKLFVPVNLQHVKHEVRDLCMLRLVHAFCQAAPMLLLQLHVLVNLQNESNVNSFRMKTLSGHLSTTALVQQTNLAQQQQKTFKDLNIVSAVLSLFSVCWALASFSKNVRLQNVHRLVLTWLGVIFQFLWRLGTVISRVISLTVYSSVYSHFVFLVIILHWISMFLWLISPKNVFHGERISRLKKATLGALIAFVYIFAYINLQEVKHRQKMVTFYVVMFLENCLLVALWMVGIWHDKPDGWYMIPVAVFCSFFGGLFFMFIYYRFFHVRRLGYDAGGRLENEMGKCINCTDRCQCYNTMDSNGITCNDKNMAVNCNQKYPHVIPGVFNCRFSNPVNVTKRKKKKPTTFVPPPNLRITATSTEQQTNNGPMSIPFWRRPLPQSHGSSENEGSSVSSRVNIQQKLQEKKQKQLAELKIIEEEIKQGKLGGSHYSKNRTLESWSALSQNPRKLECSVCTGTLSSGDDTKASLPRQPIPRTKKHIDIEPIEWQPGSPDGEKSLNDLNMLLTANLDDVNNLNKFSSNYDPIYNSFGLNGINISALAKFSHEIKINIGVMENPPPANVNNRNMSPISSQISATESNSLTRQVVPRAKMLPNIPRNPFAENYRGNFVNMYAEAAANNRPPSISPRNTTTNSPNRQNNMYDTHGRLYMENNGASAFPYNVVPPPRNKLESRATPTAPIQAQSSNTNTAGSNSVATNNNQINNLNTTKRQMQRAKTPEILLAPHYLENSRVYYDWVVRENANYRIHENDRNQTVSSGDENLDISAADESVLGTSQNPHRIPSDIDSQVSLPRSYTLPREFKYYRRNKGRKFIKNEHFIASTNSSDGDVDDDEGSCDDNESGHHKADQRLKNATPNSTHNNLGGAGSKGSKYLGPSSRQNINGTPQNIHHNYNGGNSIVNKQVNSLDLINGVENNNNSTNNSNINNNNRPMRIRMYAGKNNGMIRQHETKL